MLSEAEQGCALHSNMNVWPVLTTTRLGPVRTIRGHSTHLSFGTTGFQGDFGGESEEKGLKRHALSGMSLEFSGIRPEIDPGRELAPTTATERGDKRRERSLGTRFHSPGSKFGKDRKRRLI